MLPVVQPIQKACTRTPVLGRSCTPEHQQTGRTWSEGFHPLNQRSPWQNGGVWQHRARPRVVLPGLRRSRAILPAFLSKALHRSVKGLGWCEHVQPAHPACSVGLQWICHGCAYKDFVNLSCFLSFTVKEFCKWPQFFPGMMVSPEGYQDVFLLHTSYPHFLTQECPQMEKNFQEGPRPCCCTTPSNTICPLFPGNLGWTRISQKRCWKHPTAHGSIWDASPESCTVLIALMSWTHISAQL